MKVNKYIYFVLSFFLGGLGIHKFYIKQNKKGLIYLLFCWTGIPGIIGIIEGIKVLLKSGDSNNNIEIN